MQDQTKATPKKTSVDLEAEFKASNIQELLDQLDRDLIGLIPVKTRIRETAALLLVDRLRKSMGLTASAADSDGTITKVEFYRDTTLVGTVNAPPFTLQDTNVATATYSYTAKAYDNSGATTTSSTVFVTVGQELALYYIHADHLGTPRAITRPSDNALVWEWKNSEPFGNNLPNPNPSGLGNFEHPHGFPGQYYDKETGTFYNYFRDCYDPLMGRYCQSDPIGLAGGINTYAYVTSNPLSLVDRLGLQSCPGCTPEKLAWIVKCVENAQDSASWRMTGCSYLTPANKIICIASTLMEFYLKRAMCTSRYPECRGQYSFGPKDGT